MAQDHLIQNMPVQMLAQWANPASSPNNDLELMTDIMENGVQDPIILSIGVWSRKVRLDTGNHRIYLAPRLGLTHLPVIARVWNYCAFSNSNGDHSYDCQYITVPREWIEDEYYAKPSDVLDVMSLLTNIL
jgi:hypothetical protein